MLIIFTKFLHEEKLGCAFPLFYHFWLSSFRQFSHGFLFRLSGNPDTFLPHCIPYCTWIGTNPSRENINVISISTKPTSFLWYPIMELDVHHYKFVVLAMRFDFLNIIWRHMIVIRILWRLSLVVVQRLSNRRQQIKETQKYPCLDTWFG